MVGFAVCSEAGRNETPISGTIEEADTVTKVRDGGGLTHRSRWRWGKVVRLWVYLERGIAGRLNVGCDGRCLEDGEMEAG